MFNLDPRLENDSVFICDWKLSQVRLSKNAAFPWLILIPRQNDIVEIFDLSEDDQQQLLREIRFAFDTMKAKYNPTKMNIANLGNVVAQLHVHVVARFNTDKAWPGPIWNSGVSETYDDNALQQLVTTLQQSLEKFV